MKNWLEKVAAVRNFIRISAFLKTALFALLFSWISFVPEPMQGEYFTFFSFFLAIFFLILNLNKLLFSVKDWPVWLFLVLLPGGTLYAVNKDLALATYLRLSVTLFFIFYIAKGMFKCGSSKNNLAAIICLCGLFVFIIGLLELRSGRNFIYEKFAANPFYERYVGSRMMSTQYNPVILGSYLIFCLPFALYFSKSRKFYAKLPGAVLIFLFMAGIILSFSRGVFLAVCAMAMFYCLMKRKFRLTAGIIIFLVFFSGLCSNSRNPNICRFGFNRLIRGSYDSVISEYRYRRVRMALKVLRDYPLFGIGLNNFRERFGEYCYKNDSDEINEFRIMDNMYLTLLAETGIVGTCGFLILMISIFKKFFRSYSLLKDASNGRLLLLVMCALIGLLVNMCAYELFYWFSPWGLFAVGLGFISAYG